MLSVVMDAQENDSVGVQVGPHTTWRDALVARIRPSDHFVSDEDVFALLTEEAEDLTTAERCAVKGVTLPMYCVYKRKYQRLTLDQLRAERGRERRHRYTMAALAVGVVALVVGGMTVGAARAVYASFTVAEEATTGHAPDPIAAAPVTPAPAAHVAEPQTPVSSPKPKASRSPEAAVDVPAVVETGYRIQVTAADDLDEGRAMVALLTSEGYPAYMTKATVGNADVFRVRVGPFETLAAAEETASQLRAAGHDGAWITR